MATVAHRAFADSGQAVLIVEPHEVIRTGLSFMARSIPFVTAAITCADLGRAQHILRTRRVTTMLISETFGARQTEVLRREAVRRRVKYLVTMQQEEVAPGDDALDMVSHGAVLLENLTTESLTDTLNCLATGQAVLPAKLLQNMLRTSSGRCRARIGGSPVLTPREMQILAFLADGFSNKQIARRIAISEHGVKRNIANLLAKLNCPNRTQAVSFAIQGGILHP